MKKIVLAMLMMVGTLGYSAFAQKAAVETSNKPGWYKIAETTADLKMDKDEVVVLGKDHFKSLVLERELGVEL